MIYLTVILIALAFVSEFITLRTHIIALSPVFMLLTSIIAMYVIPYLFIFGTGGRLDALSPIEINAVLSRLNIFLVTWLLISTPLLIRLSGRMTRRDVNNMPRRDVPTKRLLYIVLFAYFAVFLLYMGSGVGFNFGEMLERMIHPRDYTYIKSGFGPLIYLKTGLGFALIVIAASWWRLAPKVVSRNLMLAVAVLLNVLGGSKSSFVMPFVGIVLVMQCATPRKRQSFAAKLRYVMLAPLLVGGLIATAFSFWGQQNESRGLERVVTQISEYGREAYLSARVIKDFPWKLDYTEDAFTDTIMAPLPRVLFPDKEFVGFYKRYWMPKYESNVVEYHTTTTGFLAEGHMVFGLLSPVIYAALFSILIIKLYESLLTARSMRVLAVAIFVTSQMYFIVRTGFFGTTLWFILIPALFIWLTYYLARKKRLFF